MGGLLPVSPPVDAIVAGVAVLFCVALVRDLGVVRFWMPENRRQVRQTVLRLRPVVGDLMFGFELGTGARTFVPATAPYLVALSVIVVADGFISGLVAGAGFRTRSWPGRGRSDAAPGPGAVGQSNETPR